MRRIWLNRNYVSMDDHGEAARLRLGRRKLRGWDRDLTRASRDRRGSFLSCRQIHRIKILDPTVKNQSQNAQAIGQRRFTRFGLLKSFQLRRVAFLISCIVSSMGTRIILCFLAIETQEFTEILKFLNQESTLVRQRGKVC